MKKIKEGLDIANEMIESGDTDFTEKKIKKLIKRLENNYKYMVKQTPILALGYKLLTTKQDYVNNELSIIVNTVLIQTMDKNTA